jgi:hypothetical protein
MTRDELELNLEDIYGTGCVTPEMLNQAAAEIAAAARTERAEKIKEKYAEQTATGRKMAKESGWCALVGTPAQKRWAVSIRAEQIGKLGDAAALTAAQVCSAKFWIDSRSEGPCGLTQLLNSDEIADQIEKTLRHNAKRRLVTAAKKAKSSASARENKQLQYLLSFQDLLNEVPATQLLGQKIGELEQDGKKYRFFLEGKNLLRIITGDESGRGQKTNNILEISEEMHAMLLKI